MSFLFVFINWKMRYPQFCFGILSFSYSEDLFYTLAEISHYTIASTI